jgi:subtilisin family serine protease
MILLCPNCQSLTRSLACCDYCNAPLDAILAEPNLAGAQVPFMDPHLHRLVERVVSQGIYKPPTSSTGAAEVAVLARITNVEAFAKLDQVRVKAIIRPGQEEEDQTIIVTARMPLSRVEEVRQERKIVASLKASQRLRPCLEKTLEDAEASTSTFLPSLSNQGAGVIVGIVDFGMDFRHRNFLNSDGTTRLLALWDQKVNDSSKYPDRYGYGQVFTKKDIDAALKQADPYEALGYAPPIDTMAQVGAHGTYVADVAAGNGNGTSCPGLAPQADIVFVDVSTFPDARGLGYSFGDVAQLVEAVDFIFKIADERKQPCVVNISLGTNGGPHDGSTLAELAFDRLVSAAPNRAIVIAAGNSFGQGIHAEGTVPPGKTVELKWRIPESDPTSNELEVWFGKNDRFEAEIIGPSGVAVARVAPGEKWELAINAQGIMSVINRLDDSVNHDNLINVFFEPGLPAGIWKLRLKNVSTGQEGGQYHAWIERDEEGQARFVRDRSPSDKYRVTNEYTLSSIANGRKTIVVGSHNAHKEGRPLARNTASGPTRNGGQKPDVTAPGEMVLAAHSRTLVLRNRQSGTSLAAAVVTGVVALLLAEAKGSLSADEIHQILIETAEPFPEQNKQWHPRYGYGRVSAAKAVAKVREKIANKNAS